MDTDLTFPNQPDYSVHDELLGDEWAYLKALVAQYPGITQFKTGAGRIFLDLAEHLPAIGRYDEQRIALCHKITETVYPLAASMSAQAVSLTLHIAAAPLAPPSSVDALTTYVALDSIHGHMLHCFLSQHHKLPDIQEASIPAGMIVLCEPFNYHYHQLSDDRRIRPRHATSNLPSRFNRNRDPFYADEYDVPKRYINPLLVTTLGGQWFPQPGSLGTAVAAISAIPAASVLFPKLEPTPQPRVKSTDSLQAEQRIAAAKKKAEPSLSSPRPVMAKYRPDFISRDIITRFEIPHMRLAPSRTKTDGIKPPRLVTSPGFISRMSLAPALKPSAAAAKQEEAKTPAPRAAHAPALAPQAEAQRGEGTKAATSRVSRPAELRQQPAAKDRIAEVQPEAPRAAARTVSLEMAPVSEKPTVPQAETLSAQPPRARVEAEPVTPRAVEPVSRPAPAVSSETRPAAAPHQPEPTRIAEGKPAPTPAEPSSAAKPVREIYSPSTAKEQPALAETRPLTPEGAERPGPRVTSPTASAEPPAYARPQEAFVQPEQQRYVARQSGPQPEKQKIVETAPSPPSLTERPRVERQPAPSREERPQLAEVRPAESRMAGQTISPETTPAPSERPMPEARKEAVAAKPESEPYPQLAEHRQALTAKSQPEALTVSEKEVAYSPPPLTRPEKSALPPAPRLTATKLQEDVYPQPAMKAQTSGIDVASAPRTDEPSLDYIRPEKKPESGIPGPYVVDPHARPEAKIEPSPQESALKPKAKSAMTNEYEMASLQIPEHHAPLPPAHLKADEILSLEKAVEKAILPHVAGQHGATHLAANLHQFEPIAHHYWRLKANEEEHAAPRVSPPELPVTPEQIAKAVFNKDIPGPKPKLPGFDLTPKLDPFDET